MEEAISTEARDERMRLVALCAHLTGDRAVAEDLAQEVLLTAWTSRHTLYGPEARSRWLTGIARHVCLAWARSAGRERRRRADPGPSDPGEMSASEVADNLNLDVVLERGEVADLLDRALALLPADTRAVLIQRYVEQAPQAEIAARLGVSEKAVSMRVHRGTVLLRKVLTTRLGQEASAYGLIAPQTEGWQDTRLWCPQCGRCQLRTRLGEPPTTVAFTCHGCQPDGAAVGWVFPLANTTFAHLLGPLRQPRAIMRTAAAWVYPYFRAALDEGMVPCTHCGRATRVQRLAWQEAGTASEDRQLVVDCTVCGHVVSTSTPGLLGSLPEVQRFWRVHRRIETLPCGPVEAAGVACLVTRFQSVTGRTHLDIIWARDTLRVVAVTGAVPGN